MNKILKIIILITFFFLTKTFIPCSEAQQFPGYFIKNEGISDNGSFCILNSGNSKSFYFNDHIVYQFFTTDTLKMISTVNNIQLSFKQQNSKCVPELSEPLKGIVNQFHGNDPEAWLTNLSTYKFLTYKNIYSNIDLKYYNLRNEIKTDFIIHKGGHPEEIRMIYNGIDSIFINTKGELILRVGNATLTERIPEAYQLIDGCMKFIEVKYTIQNNEVSFEVQNFNRNHDLIIDPQLVYSTFIGGYNNDIQFTGDIERDASGNIYFSGSTNSSNFPITPGVYTTNAPTDVDVLLVKMNPTATQMIFSTVIGGYGTDNGFAIELSGSSNDIIVAAIASSDFPTTSGVISPGFNGGQYDVAVFKLSNNGNNLLFSTYIGGSQEDYPFDMILDNSGNILISGQTSGNFPTTPGVYQPNYGGGPWDAFIAKLNPDATILLKSTYIGGSDLDRGGGLAIDSEQNIYLSGSANNGFPVTSGCFDNTFNGGYIDISIAKLSSDFSTLLYASFLGTNGEDWVRGDLNFDSEGNLVIVGSAGQGLTTTDNALDKTFNGGANDGIIAKISPAGNSLLYCSYLGSSGEDLITNAKYNSSNELIMTGYCESGFPTTSCAFDQTYNGNTDAFIAVLNSTLNSLLYSTYIGGNSLDNGLDIIPFHDSTILIGETQSNNFPVTSNAYDQSYNGGTDLFLMRHYFIGGSANANAGSDASICEGDSYALTSATASSPATYLWTTSGNGTFSNATLLNPLYFPGSLDINAGSVTLTLTVTTPSCGQATDQLVLIIKHRATVFAGSDATICDNPGTYSLNDASANYAVSYSWTSNGTGTFNNASILHPVYTPSAADIAAGSVILTITAASQSPCNNAVDQMTLFINRKAMVFAGNDATICESPGVFLLDDASAQYETTLLWTTSGSGNFNNNSILHPSYMLSASDIASGSVILTLTATSSSPCDNSTDQIKLQIDHFTAVYAGNDDTICALAGSFDLENSTTSNATSLLWNTSGTGTFNNPDILHPTYIPSSSDISNGHIILTVTSSSVCNTATDQMNLFISKPSVAYAGNDATICESVGSYPITGASVQNAESILWTTGGSGSFDDPTRINAVYYPGATDISSGYVQLTLKALSQFPCNDSVDVMNLFINHITTAFAGEDEIICETTTSFITSNATAFNASYLNWMSSGSGSFINPDTLYTTYLPDQTDINNGIVQLILEAGSACNSSFDTIFLYINRQSTVNAGDDFTVCEGSDFQLTDAVSEFETSLIWTHDGAGTLQNPSSINPTYIPAENETGTVTFTLTGSSENPCPDAKDQMILSIQPAPVADAGTDDTVCHKPFPLNSASASYFTSVNWSFLPSEAGTLSDITTLDPTFIPAPDFSGKIQFILTAHGMVACSDQVIQDTAELFVLQQLSVNAGPDQVIEPESSTSFTATVTNGSGNYTWWWSPVELFENNSISNPTTADLTNSTEFIVFVLDNDNGCSDLDTINVYISIDLMHPIAVIDWDTTYTSVPAHTIILNNDTLPEGLFFDVSIEVLPQNGSLNINTDNSIVYTANVDFSGIDHYIYKIRNIRNTSLYDTAVVMILVKKANPRILDPTGFISPNGDNLNDTWYIRNIKAYPENEVFIFNRWGDLIKKIINYDNDQFVWRGEDKHNNKVPDGTYYYSIKIGKDVITGWIFVRNNEN